MRLMMLCICAALLAAGCSDKKADDPQLTNLRLTNDLLDSLGRKDHRTAAAQTAKLRTVLPESSFLSMLEESENSNIYLSKAQPLLNRGDLAGAAGIINQGLKDYPMNRYLLRARQRLEHLAEFQKTLAAAANPAGAADLLASLGRIKTMSAAYPDSSFIAEFIERKEKQAAAMEKHEIKRAYDSLVTEYRLLAVSEPALAKIVAAQIEYEKDNIEASRR